MKKHLASSITYFILLSTILICSCNTYKNSILFSVDDEDFSALAKAKQEAQANYVIQAHDQLEVVIYTNKGESLIDPNNALDTQGAVVQENPLYTINSEGNTDLPILGAVNLGGLSLGEANAKLAELYSVYYKNPFVQTKYANKRVVVLGASKTKVVPLNNEGMNLLEVLALAGGVYETGKGNNIRVIRGDLDNPEISVIDLTTFDGMRSANLNVQPNDIIYIEPVRRPFSGLRDFTPILGAITSVLALIVALNR